jgi:hypothetical protein
MAIKTWEEIKNQGSEHYKNGVVEPIDLYRSMGAIRIFALCSIIKYASRNIINPIIGGNNEQMVSNKDMFKIRHYVDILICSCGDGNE